MLLDLDIDRGRALNPGGGDWYGLSAKTKTVGHGVCELRAFIGAVIHLGWRRRMLLKGTTQLTAPCKSYYFNEQPLTAITPLALLRQLLRPFTPF